MKQFSEYAYSVGKNVIEYFNLEKNITTQQLPSTYQSLIHKLYYARFIPEENRRESWGESVLRFMNFLFEQTQDHHYTFSTEEFLSLYNGLLHLDVFPSMRLLWCAGEAVRKNPVSNFNCAFTGIEDFDAFAEVLFLGMSGTGVGFSVEERYISKLPVVPHFITSRDGRMPYVIADSREGWADALKAHISNLYRGRILSFDYSLIRPEGARLVTAGGFASGYLPLKKLLDKITEMFKNAQGRKLTALEVHDIVCYVAQAAVAGGTRRCLPLGTLVDTVNRGQIPIEHVHVGELVYSYDEHRKVQKKVLAKQMVGKKLLMRISLKRSAVYCSKEHRWPVSLDARADYVVYKETKELKVGDLLLTNRYIPTPIFGVTQTGILKECVDLQIEDTELFIADNMVTHNSALISFSDLENPAMQTAKYGEWYIDNVQRALANNSAVYSERPSMSVFSQEWQNLVDSQSGERGIYNELAVKKKIAQIGRRDPLMTYRSNPCCVSGDTYLLTDKGHVRIIDVVGEEVNVWNGYEFSPTKPFYAGDADLYSVILSDGTELKCTLNHKFAVIDKIKKDGTFSYELVELKDLHVRQKLAKFSMPVVETGKNYEIDAYSQGFYSGDGNTNMSFSWLYATKYQCEPRLIGTFGKEHNCAARKCWKHGPMLAKNFVPIDGTKEYCLHWLAGVLDADGCVTRDKNGNGLQVSSVNRQFLLDIKLMLSRLGCKAKVVNGNMDEERTFQGYPCQSTYRLLIGNMDTYFLLDLGLKTNRLVLHSNKPQRDARQFVRIVFIEKFSENERVFCVTEPMNHTATFNGVVTGQSEISLQHRQFCNLSNVNIRPMDSLGDVQRKVQLATIFGTIQSTLTDFSYLNSSWKDNTEHERLLGVSLSGLADHPAYFPTLEQIHQLPPLLNYLRFHAVKTNREWARKLHIHTSNAITTIKPSGDSSQLADVSSGIHARHAPYYLRRIRMNKLDPIAQALQTQGFPCEESVTDKNILVFAFPQRSPQNTRIYEKDLHPIEHASIWLQYAKYWSEHMVSCTIKIHQQSQWNDMKEFIYRNFDDICGLSFLPYSDHIYAQAPYEAISSEQYEKEKSVIPEIDLEGIKEYSNNTVSPMACEGLTCQIKSV